MPMWNNDLYTNDATKDLPKLVVGTFLAYISDEGDDDESIEIKIELRRGDGSNVYIKEYDTICYHGSLRYIMTTDTVYTKWLRHLNILTAYPTDGPELSSGFKLITIEATEEDIQHQAQESH